jgi:hypothetical protein
MFTAFLEAFRLLLSGREHLSQHISQDIEIPTVESRAPHPVSVELHTVLMFIVDHADNLERCKSRMPDLEEWVIMRNCLFAALTQIKIRADSTLVADPNDRAFSTAITDKVVVDDLASLLLRFFELGFPDPGLLGHFLFDL